jgi:drug/metabolite transporter (DMT)-like permease
MGGVFALGKGARYMIVSALFFSLMSLQVKLVGERIPSQEIVLARGLVSLALSYALLRRAGLSPWGSHRKLLVLRGIFGFVALSCFYYAVTQMPLADATVIQYTSPIWTALLAALVLAEPLGLLVLACALASLFGVALVVRPAALFGESAVDPTVAVIALAGAVVSAGAYVVVRALRDKEDPLVVVFYFPLVAVPASLPAVAANFVMPRGVDWLLLLGIGVTTQLGQVFLTRGLALEPAGKAMAITYLQIPFAALWGVIVFAHIPDVWTAAGAILIVTASLLAARASRARS